MLFIWDNFTTGVSSAFVKRHFVAPKQRPLHDAFWRRWCCTASPIFTDIISFWILYFSVFDQMRHCRFLQQPVQ